MLLQQLKIIATQLRNIRVMKLVKLDTAVGVGEMVTKKRSVGLNKIKQKQSTTRLVAKIYC